ncbi:MAG: GWxTD domain-containing protein [Ignavibacteriales bacterium]|nr:MAG: GWxTD domain-containing protein [Ignavibacteriales bacterium]
MKKLLFILLLASLSFAQRKLNVDLDFSRFLYDDTTGLWELYYGFRTDELKPLTADNKFVVKGIIQISIIEKGSNVEILNKSWQVSDESDSLSRLKNKQLNGTISIRLNNNNFKVIVKAFDANNPSSVDSANFDLAILPIPTDRLSISDIQLASIIKNADNKSDSYFVKNNYEIIPNPSGVYGENLPVLYSYSEFYNLDINNSTKYLQVNYKILNSLNVNMFNRNKYIPTKNKSIVDIATINVVKYPTGVYTLIVELKDTSSALSVSQVKKFYLFNPGIVDTASQLALITGNMSSEFSVMEEDELNRYFDYSKYLATQEDINTWKKIHTEEGKKEYLNNFWLSKNKNSGIDDKGFQMEYFRRLEIANERYTTMQRQGWKSDKGRIYMIYGEPSEIQRYPNEPDMKPYEIWNYNMIDNGVIFVFANLEGYGEYSLIHSTKRGELSDEKWQRFIQTK